MKKVATYFGYDIFEMTKEECRKNGVIFPNLCAFPSDRDEKEDGEREWLNSVSDFESLQKAEKWCKKYHRDQHGTTPERAVSQILIVPKKKKMTRQEKYPDTKYFHYYNANPKNRITGDCWARAISTALEIPYNQVVMEMAELHCEIGKACPIDEYLKRKGWIKHRQPRKDDNTKYTGKEFCEKLSHDVLAVGKSVVANIGGHHIVCIKETSGLHGVPKVHDIFDSTDGCIGNFWTKTEPF